jgi:hypothetical protein
MRRERTGEEQTMDDAALVVWLLSAGAGLTMAGIWLARGGLRQRDEVLEDSYVHVADTTEVAGLAPPGRRSQLSPWMIALHATLAALGLYLWIYYVGHEGEEGTGIGALPPLTVALLLTVAAVGVVMVRRWRADRARLDGEQVPKRERPPEQRIPAAVVVLHGLLAVTTVVLVFLTAVGVGV